jgi:hypothetical protein
LPGPDQVVGDHRRVGHQPLQPRPHSHGIETALLSTWLDAAARRWWQGRLSEPAEEVAELGDFDHQKYCLSMTPGVLHDANGR